MAFLQPGPARQPALQAPAIVLWLIGLLLAAHGARMLLVAPADEANIIVTYAFIPVRYAFSGEFWDLGIPFLSHIFLHGDWPHVILNSLWLLAFGPIVARRFGGTLFILFFLVCGAVGAAAYLLFNWGSPDPVVGASGAVSGLMAAGLRLMPGLFSWAIPGEMRLAPILSRPILTFTAAWAALNVVVGLIGAGFLGSSGAIAWQAHLGGYFAGLLLAGGFDSLRPRTLAPPLGEG
jgi:membrane associated rhomboid family serine protease